MLYLRLFARAFSSCGEWGPLFIAVRGPLTITASLVAEHRLQTCRLSSCGSWAQLLHGMWDLPRPGLEPVSPAFAGRFSTTVPPGKPESIIKGKWQWKRYRSVDWRSLRSWKSLSIRVLKGMSSKRRDDVERVGLMKMRLWKGCNYY